MDDNGHGLTLRELVLEVRADVKDMKENFVDRDTVQELDVRVTRLENTGLRVSGAWTMLGITMASMVALGGLVVATVQAIGV